MNAEVIEPEDKDWTWVLGRPCPDCGFDARAIPATAVAGRTRELIGMWEAVLARPAVTVRPAPRVWSPLEYGCHVRDVCTITDLRLGLMLAEDGARFRNWDQDATAVDDHYGEADPAVVAVRFAAAAEAVADRLDGVAGDQWARTGLRSNGSVFTVDSLSRYFLHDLVHHVWDVG